MFPHIIALEDGYIFTNHRTQKLGAYFIAGMPYIFQGSFYVRRIEHTGTWSSLLFSPVSELFSPQCSDDGFPMLVQYCYQIIQYMPFFFFGSFEIFLQVLL